MKVNFNDKYLKYKLKYLKEKYQVRGGADTSPPPPTY